MSFVTSDIELNKKLEGKEVAGASSSLTAFAVKFTDGSGLLLQATGTPESATIDCKLMTADELPTIGDAVCKVEWAWIVSSKVSSVQTVTGSFKLNLVPAGTLTILSSVWEGKTFLSFMPYKAP